MHLFKQIVSPNLRVPAQVDPATAQSQQSVVEVEHPALEAGVADDLRDAERERVGLVLPLEVIIPENHAELV